MGIAASIVLTFLLTLANGFFSMSEMALTTAKRTVLERDAESGDKRATKALELASDSTDFLATIQVAITLVGFFAAMVSSSTLSDPLTQWVSGFDINWLTAIAPTASPIVITLVVSYLSIVIGELVPKRIGLSDAEGMAKRVAGTIMVFRSIARPLVRFTQSSANGLSHLLRIKSADDRQDVSGDDIRYMVDDADDLSDKEKDMIGDIFDLADTIVREVMVPRVDVTSIEDTSTVYDALQAMKKTGYSRLPVWHGDIDHIVGIAHVKDLTDMAIRSKLDAPITECVRDATFVPDTKDIVPLLSEMQGSREQMAVVVDEYGGTAGVITIEDIVEEIVGEIHDEYDPDNRYITKMPDGGWVVDGRFSIDDAIELGWPIEENDEYETVAGFVLKHLDSVPKPGDELNIDGWKFHVQAMRGNRVTSLRVTHQKEDTDDTNGTAGQALEETPPDEATKER